MLMCRFSLYDDESAHVLFRCMEDEASMIALKHTIVSWRETKLPKGPQLSEIHID